MSDCINDTTFLQSFWINGLNSSDDYILIYNEELELIYSNISTNNIIKSHPNLKHITLNYLQLNILQNDKFSFAVHLESENNNDFYIEFSVTIFFHNTKKYFFLTGHEITQQKILENKLLTTENKFKTLTEFVPAGIFITNNDGFCLYTNKKWLEIAGISFEESIGDGWAKAVHEDDRERVFQEWNSCTSQKKEFSCEYRFKTPNGKITWVYGSAVELKDNQGETTGYIGALLDIDKLKETEEKLNKAKSVAEQSSQAKSEFIALVSHEIRTTMNAILGYTELLRKIIENNEQKEYVSGIVAGAKRLLKLVNDLLDLAKIEAHKMEIYMDTCNLVQICNEIYRIFDAQVKAKNLQFFLECTKNPFPLIIIDEVKVTSVLHNLVSNAIKYTETGKIILRIDYNCNSSKDKLDLILEVEDTGIGIAEKDLSHVFTPFYQKKSVNNNLSSGTGLGLSITHQLVTLFQGEIIVTSTLGQGSKFKVKIPQIPYIKTSTSEKNMQIAKEYFNLNAEINPSNRLLIQDLKHVNDTNLNGLILDFAALSKEAIEEIKFKFYPTIAGLISKMQLNNIQEFASDLRNFGIKTSSLNLVKYADDLLEIINSFNDIEIINKLELLKELIEKNS